jgi:hypothetical protein
VAKLAWLKMSVSEGLPVVVMVFSLSVMSFLPFTMEKRVAHATRWSALLEGREIRKPLPEGEGDHPACTTPEHVRGRKVGDTPSGTSVRLGV